MIIRQLKLFEIESRKHSLQTVLSKLTWRSLLVPINNPPLEATIGLFSIGLWRSKLRFHRTYANISSKARPPTSRVGRPSFRPTFDPSGCGGTVAVKVAMPVMTRPLGDADSVTVPLEVISRVDVDADIVAAATRKLDCTNQPKDLLEPLAAAAYTTESYCINNRSGDPSIQPQ